MANDQKNGNFICGVVEGFYGRPWTTEQRKDLFRKLKKWGMDSYVYAPKDDYKHRAYWRELYTVEEADHLTSLITAAKEQGIVFYYALSPGLDMSYSNPKEVQSLKRKLEQVSQFGCDAFALLFDDIESELSKTDKEVFQTFANAQVSITNEMFTVLNSPRFLFCPTQYCSSRAVPSVVQSEYLNTLGSKLYPEIDIMWTGTKVISKNFSIESIQEITEILRRPPVIWDNLHANDYDQKRVFLGPYAGRSPELISLLRGVLTNPNCEFHANTIAIHTLASWSKCNSDAKINNSISADIKLETENDDGITNEDIPSCLSKNIYHPRYALRKAIIEWLPEFSIEKVAWGPISKPQPPVTMVMPILPIIQSINTCMSLTTTTTTTAMNSNTSKVPEMNTTQLQALADVCSTVSSVQPISNPVMNSLVSATKVVTNDEIPNPITSASVSNIEIPKNIPISASITVPIMTLKSGELKTIELPSETCNNSYENSTNNHVIDEEEEITEIEENISQEKNKDENNIPIDDDDIPIAESSSPPTILKNVEDHGKMSIQNNENNIGTITNTDVVPATDSLQMCDNLSPLCTEPMECNSQASPKDIGKNSSDDVVMSETVSTGSAGSSMQIESSESLTFSQAEMVEDFDKPNDLMISVDDLYLLCDLFYLPFEHGSRGLQLLNEFNWLKTNANVLLHTSKKSEAIKPEVQEWIQRSEKFAGLCQSVITLSQKIAFCVNKELSYDLFSYVWDIAGVITLLNAFVKWLALGNFPTNINSYTMGSYSWYSKGWKETFMSGEQEPWVFRGGLTADLQRLMPIDGGNDLFIYKLPDVPTTNYYSIRPYTHIDERQIKQIYHKMNIELLGQIPENLQEILFDREVNPYITLNSGMCLTIQNANNIIVGFACAAVDCRIFYRNLDICWIPEMCIKYPKTIVDNIPNVNYLIKDYINFFHNFKYDCPQDVYSTHPSIINCCVSKEDLIIDQSIAKRLITVLLAVLRSNGSFGCHICLNENDSNNSTSNNNLIEFYTKLGFSEIYRDTITSCVYLGRNF